jgi:UDPglucose 6-dehydrogenase
MRLCVIGSGYVGLVAGAGFSDFGNDVVCVDVDAGKIERLNRGEVPIYEPSLDTLIARNMKAGRLTFSTDLPAAIASAEVAFIAVATPQGEDGSADLKYVEAVADAIGRNMRGYLVIVNKSTVPVGTADKVKAIIAARTKHPFAVVSNPEFLKEGDAIADFMKPDRVVIGVDDPQAKDIMGRLYASFLRTSDRIHFMDPRSAELTKYAANSMLAVRISFMNELANLADHIGADIELVRKAMGADPRIGSKFLFPGAGFGGSCFPKDLKALIRTALNADSQLEVVTAAERANARQKNILFLKLERHFGGAKALAGKTVALWGLAFKPSTDDIREAPALTLIDRLLAVGTKVVVHDPVAMDNVRAIYGDRIGYGAGMYETAEKADALVLVTEWHEYRNPDFDRLKKVLNKAVLVDGRNQWPLKELRERGFAIQAIGRG